jgi:putative Holliday junction resolvase
MKRVMCVDIGEKRIGIAVSDPLGITAQGVETYTRTGQEDARYVADKAKALGAELIVAGLPLNMNGSEGPAALSVRAFRHEVKALGAAVAFQDERLTTGARNARCWRRTCRAGSGARWWTSWPRCTSCAPGWIPIRYNGIANIIRAIMKGNSQQRSRSEHGR